METQLIDSVERKLGDLDHKVRAYRHDLLADFQRYYHDELRDVNPTIASTVGKAIERSLSKYPALRPDVDELIRQQPAESRDPSMSNSNPGSASSQRSPPPLSVSGAAEAPTDLHEREKELQGLFTPSYLPLLDTLPVPPRPVPSPSYSPSYSSPNVSLLPESGTAGGSGQGVDMNRQQDNIEAQAQAQAQTQAEGASPQTPERPGHVRRSTDDTCSSVVSDKSDTTKARPRSALRKSSSSSKFPTSPRRVRFEFEGAEVLPTSSPDASETGFSHIATVQSGDAQLASASILDHEDEYQQLPPPRKISSSEALRALSRTPLEEGTVWTVVTSGSDKPSASSQEMPSHVEEPLTEGQVDAPTPAAKATLASAVEFEPPNPPVALGSIREGRDEEQNTDEDSSGDEFLAMAKTRKSSASPADKSPSKTSKHRSPRPAGKRDEPLTGHGLGLVQGTGPSQTPDDVSIDEDDDLFQFEPSGGLSAPPRPRPVTPPTKEEVIVEEEEEEPSSNDAGLSQSVNSTSMAVPITKPVSPRGSSTPTTSRFQTGSIGSYKGRPVIMPVVRNPEVHAQAASLGQFNTFVGGLDGRSGMDEGDLSSFRASLVQGGFSGTPRSLTERLFMEEAMERARGGATPP